VLLCAVLAEFQLLLVAMSVLGIIALGDYANEYTIMQVSALADKERELGELELSLSARASKCMATLEYQQHNPGATACHAKEEARVRSRIRRLRESMTTMAQIRRSLKLEDRFYPVTILGVRADRFLLGNIAIGASSLVALGARLVFK